MPPGEKAGALSLLTVPSEHSKGHSAQGGRGGNLASTLVSPEVIQSPISLLSLKHGGFPQS